MGITEKSAKMSEESLLTKIMQEPLEFSRKLNQKRQRGNSYSELRHESAQHEENSKNVFRLHNAKTRSK